MISQTSRSLLFGLAAAYAVLGAFLFCAPTMASAHFAWHVSPLVTMTIGGWCLGNAWAAFVAARQRRWAAIIGAIVYFTAFGLLELGVLIAFHQRVVLSGALAWGYVLVLFGSCMVAAACIIDGTLHRPAFAIIGRRLRTLEYGYLLLFILFVGFLGFYGLTAAEGSRGLNASIFPERLSMLSLRSFGAFYLALTIGVVPFLIMPGLGNALAHALAFQGLVVIITLAAAVFIDEFDFSGRPTQAIYFAVYLLVGVINGLYLVRYGSGEEAVTVTS